MEELIVHISSYVPMCSYVIYVVMSSMCSMWFKNGLILVRYGLC